MFCVYVSSWWGSLNRHSCTWKKSSQHSPDDSGCPMLTITRTPWSWQPILLPGSHIVLYFDETFSYHRWYSVPIPEPGFVFYLHAPQRCDRELSRSLFMNCGSQRKNKVGSWCLSGCIEEDINSYLVLSVYIRYVFFLDWEKSYMSYIEFGAVNLDKSISWLRNSLAENNLGDEKVFI